MSPPMTPRWSASVTPPRLARSPSSGIKPRPPPRPAAGAPGCRRLGSGRLDASRWLTAISDCSARVISRDWRQSVQQSGRVAGPGSSYPGHPAPIRPRTAAGCSGPSFSYQVQATRNHELRGGCRGVCKSIRHGVDHRATPAGGPIPGHGRATNAAGPAKRNSAERRRAAGLYEFPLGVWRRRAAVQLSDHRVRQSDGFLRHGASERTSIVPATDDLGTARQRGQFPVTIATNQYGVTSATLILTIGPPALGFFQ